VAVAGSRPQSGSLELRAGHVARDLIAQARGPGQRGRVQLGVAARQPQRVARWQVIAGQGREQRQPGAHGLQAGQVGRIDEGESGVVRDGDGAAGQALGQCRIKVAQYAWIVVHIF
jgi:hypothetical protein